MRDRQIERQSHCVAYLINKEDIEARLRLN